MDLEQIQIRLRESIKNSSYSQKEIAKAVNVSPQTISKYMKQNIFPAAAAAVPNVMNLKTVICLFLSITDLLKRQKIRGAHLIMLQ